MGHFEKRRWTGDLNAYGGRKSRASYTFQAYVPDRIANQTFDLPGDIAGIVTEADRAVVALNETPPAIASLEALARQLLRAESVGSSRIEGLELSHRRLARAAFDAKHAQDVTAESILGNIRAMEHAIALATAGSDFTVRDITTIHRELFASTRDRHLAGIVRDGQSWIGGASDGPRDAEFVPPPHEYVDGLLDDLAEFISREDLPPVAQAAIAHAQFETIHPFADGNGRVGRCLIHVVLRRRGIAKRYVPPISLVLAGNAKAYIGGLTDFRTGREAAWCGTFAAAVRTAAAGASAFAERIARLQASWLVKAGDPRDDSAARKLIALLPSHPILDVSTTEKITGVSNQAARLTMLRLEEAGILKRVNVGKRNRAWEATGLFELLNQYEREMVTPAGSKRPGRPAPR